MKTKIMMFVCVALLVICGFSGAGESAELAITSMSAAANNQVNVILAWTNVYFSYGSFSYQGMTVPAVTFTPSRIILVKFDTQGTVVSTRDLGYSASGSTTDVCYSGYQYLIEYIGYHPVTGRYCSGQTNRVTVTYTVGPPGQPTLAQPQGVILGQPFMLDWNTTANTAIYQLEQDTRSDFSTSNHPQYWPQISEERITLSSGTTQYFRVRSWNRFPEQGGVASSWSNIVTVSFIPPAPVLAEIPSALYPSTITFDWSDVAASRIYEMQISLGDDFSSVVAQYWPTDSREEVAAPGVGTYYARVRSWDKLPEEGGVATEWSNVISCVIARPVPVLNDVAEAYYPSALAFEWSDCPVTRIYELQLTRTSDFSSVDAQFWPGESAETVHPPYPGEWYARVRSWDRLPEEGGTASEWSNIVTMLYYPSQPAVFLTYDDTIEGSLFTVQWSDDNPAGSIEYTVTCMPDDPERQIMVTTEDKSCVIGPLYASRYGISVTARTITSDPEQTALSVGSDEVYLQVMTEDAFELMVMEKAFRSLLDATYPNGLTRDRYHSDRPALPTPLGDETDAASAAGTGFYLSSLTVGVEHGWITRSAAYKRAVTTLKTMLKVPHYNGFVYHYMKPNGEPSDKPYREVSSIDTALFVASALQAGKYFGGDVMTYANQFYRRVQWTKMFNWYTYLMHMGWDETRGLFGEYNNYSEALLMYVLATGSPTYPIPNYSYYNFARNKGSYKGDTMIYTYGGQLFTYQYPLAWINFQNQEDALGVKWHENTLAAVRANREYCIDHPEKGYSDLFWGLSACDGPTRYEAYGAQPAINNVDDGTIAPYTVAGAMPFERTYAMDVLKHLYTGLREDAWGYYGFVDGVNPNQTWGKKYYLSLDQGLLVLMMENSRTGMVQKYFMKNTCITTAFTRLRFKGYATGFRTLENFEDGNYWSPDTSVGWWDSDGSTVYQRSPEYWMSHGGKEAMRINYNKNNLPWSCIGAYISPTNPMRNFTNRAKLKFWVHGEAEILVKLRDRSQREYELGTKKAVTPNSWTYIEFPLSKVTGITKSDIDNILFFVEPGKAQGTGSIVIDDIIVE